jgi:uncharacterized membrane protein
VELKRFWRHVVMNPVKAARAFPTATMDAIEREISAHERLHRGEVCFVVEAELTSAQLWSGLPSRVRAKEVFAQRGVWNTEENNGVLIYVLLADQAVEVIADRGIDLRAGPAEWNAICRMMEAHFAAGRYQEGALAGVGAVSLLLERHFPAAGEGRNELPDRPVRI